MSDNSLLIMTTAGISTVGGIVHQSLTVKGHGKTQSVSVKPPKMRPVIGGFLVGVFLFGFNAVTPQVTHALCILVIVGALMMNGPKLLIALQVGGLTK